MLPQACYQAAFNININSNINININMNNNINININNTCRYRDVQKELMHAEIHRDLVVLNAPRSLGQ